MRADQQPQSTVKVAVYDNTAFSAAQFSALILSLVVIVVLLITVVT